jgi:hypothetical protein
MRRQYMAETELQCARARERERERKGTEADACAKSNFQSKLDLVQTLPLNAQQI